MEGFICDLCSYILVIPLAQQEIFNVCWEFPWWHISFVVHSLPHAREKGGDTSNIHIVCGCKRFSAVKWVDEDRTNKQLLVGFFPPQLQAVDNRITCDSVLVQILVLHHKETECEEDLIKSAK